MVGHLPSKHKALSVNPSTAKKKEKTTASLIPLLFPKYILKNVHVRIPKKVATFQPGRKPSSGTKPTDTLICTSQLPEL
jgi:hypothetical protein